MFDAGDFVAAATLRFGAVSLRQRMRGAADDAAADLELEKIAASVISRVQTAVSQGVGWPLPGVWPPGSEDEAGTDISGELYADVWPRNLLQMAFDLFNWRTISGLEAVSLNQQKVGAMAEAYFVGLESGSISLGIGGSLEPGSPAPIAARNRDGSSNLIEVPDRENVLDTFTGRGWDR